MVASAVVCLPLSRSTANAQRRAQRRQYEKTGASTRTRSRHIVADITTVVIALGATGTACGLLALAGMLGPWTSVGATAELRVLATAGVLLLLLGLTDRRGANEQVRPNITKVAARSAVASTLAVITVEPALAIAHGAGLHLVSAFTVASTVICGLVGIFLSRSPIGASLRTKVAIYGASDAALKLEADILARGDLHLVGVFEQRQSQRPDRTVKMSTDGTLDDLIELTSCGKIDLIVIALPASATGRIAEIARRLRQFPVAIQAPMEIAAHVIAESKTEPAAAETTHLGGSTLVTCRRAPIRDWGAVLKTTCDRGIAAALLIALSPLLAVIAMAIKLDSKGSVFFRQRRHGLAGQSIVVWKFRTMRVMEDGAVVQQAAKGDPRVTRVGRILRKTSLDELPQLINVLEGSMSLVGPRPHAIAHNEHFGKLIDSYDCRNQVRPGITGWAQINGHRGETQTVERMARRVEHDIWYVSNWSFLLDLKILLLTPIYGLVHKNAY